MFSCIRYNNIVNRLKETLAEMRESYLKELDSYKCHMLSTQQQIINQLQENHRLAV